MDSSLKDVKFSALAAETPTSSTAKDSRPICIDPDAELPIADNNSTRTSATQCALDHPNWVLALVCFVQNMINGTFTCILLALPVLSEDFEVDESVIVWVMFAPQLVAGMLSTPLGRASDLFGRKRMWFIGTGLHLLSMIGSGMAPSIEVLLAARVLTGLGWATEGPAGGAMVMSVFPKHKRGYVISILTIFGTLSSSCGMILGGFLMRVVSWRVLFLGNAPIVCLAIPFGFWVLPDCNNPCEGLPEEEDNEPKAGAEHCKQAAATEEKASVLAAEGKTSGGEAASKESIESPKPGLADFDWTGALLLSLCFGTVLTGINRAGPWGWDSRRVLGLLVAGVATCGLFAMHQRRMGRDAILPAFFLQDSVILTTIFSKLCLMSVYMIALILVPYYLEVGLSYSPEEASYMLCGRPFFFALSSFFFGKKCEKMVDCAKSAIVGSCIFAVAVGFLTFCLDIHVAFVVVGVWLQGLGAGLIFPTLTTCALKRVEDRDISVFSGFTMVLDLLAMLAGQAIIVSLVESYGGMENVAAYSIAFHCTLPLTIGPLCAAFWLLYLIKHKVPISAGGLAPDGETCEPIASSEVVLDTTQHIGVPTEEIELDVAPTTRTDCDIEACSKQLSCPHSRKNEVESC